MTVIGVVLDASNIAAERRDEDVVDFRFERVADVRRAWAAEHPNSRVHAVIDAGVRARLLDRPLAAEAEREKWLEVATGDADDEILALAARFGAYVVSHDTFAHAREDHPWLEGSPPRVYRFSRRHGQVVLTAHPLGRVTPERARRARRAKSAKARLYLGDDDRRWRCAAPEHARCPQAGAEVSTASLTGGPGEVWFHTCGYPAVEHHKIAAPRRAPGRAGVALMHEHLFVRRLVVPRQGMTVGRRGGGGVDVTAGLPAREAGAISREHLRIEPGDDGGLMAAQPAGTRNTTFLNPELDARGLPRSNRLVPGVWYPLLPGDHLLLGGGTVRLLVDDGAGTGTVDKRIGGTA